MRKKTAREKKTKRQIPPCKGKCKESFIEIFIRFSFWLEKIYCTSKHGAQEERRQKFKENSYDILHSGAESSRKLAAGRNEREKYKNATLFNAAGKSLCVLVPSFFHNSPFICWLCWWKFRWDFSRCFLLHLFLVEFFNIRRRKSSVSTRHSPKPQISLSFVRNYSFEDVQLQRSEGFACSSPKVIRWFWFTFILCVSRVVDITPRVCGLENSYK